MLFSSKYFRNFRDFQVSLVSGIYVGLIQINLACKCRRLCHSTHQNDAFDAWIAPNGISISVSRSASVEPALHLKVLKDLWTSNFTVKPSKVFYANKKLCCSRSFVLQINTKLVLQKPQTLYLLVFLGAGINEGNYLQKISLEIAVKRSTIFREFTMPFPNSRSTKPK